MRTPSERDEIICAMFDSFCVAVIMYKALQSLPDNQRMVLLYDFWLNLSDKEISKRMEVTADVIGKQEFTADDLHSILKGVRAEKR